MGFSMSCDLHRRSADPVTKKPKARVAAMAERRIVILKTAERLIRDEHSTSFSMRQLAIEAGFSTATTYNLIGSKATVLYSILTATMDKLFVERAVSPKSGDPLDLLLEYGMIPAREFVRDRGLLQPLFQHLLGVPDKIHHPHFMKLALNYWIFTCDAVSNLVPLRAPLQILDAARHMQLFALGALELWVHEDLSDDLFFDELRHGLTGFAVAFWELDNESAIAERLSKHREIIGAFACLDDTV